jgi:hypothetical protein
MRCRAALESLDSDHAAAAARTRVGRVVCRRCVIGSLLRRRRLGRCGRSNQLTRPHEDWWGTVIGFQPPGSIDFHHVIHIGQLRATVDVHIHYSFEWEGQSTLVNRWLVLDLTMPRILRPLRRLITERFEKGKCPNNGRG